MEFLNLSTELIKLDKRDYLESQLISRKGRFYIIYMGNLVPIKGKICPWAVH